VGGGFTNVPRDADNSGMATKIVTMQPTERTC
jgi:hypothetical protein